MDLRPDKLLWLFLVVAIVGWLFFTFSAKVAAIILKRALGLVVLKFRLASLGCVKDVSIQFKKGAIASVSIGELRLIMRKQGLQKLWDWKLQLVVGDIEFVLTQSAAPNQGKKGSTKTSVKGNSTSARTLLTLVAKSANYLNVSVSDIVIRGERSNAYMEIKDLGLDLFSEEGTNLSLGLKLVVEPVSIHIDAKRGVSAPLRKANESEDAQGLIKEFNPVFILQRMVVQTSFYYGSEPGLSVGRFEVACGDASVHLRGKDLAALLNLFGGKSPRKTEKISKDMDSIISAQSSDDVTRVSPSRRRVKLPEKMLFDLRVLSVTFQEGQSGAKIENRILGMHLQGGKSLFPDEREGQSSQYDVQLDLGEVYLLQGTQNAVMEALRVVVTASLELPTEASELSQIELDVKLGGLQFNVIPTTLEQCLKFALSLMGSKDRAVVKEASEYQVVQGAQQRPRQRAQNKLLWRCSFSAPEMGITVFGSDDVRAFHCSSQTAHVYANTTSSEGVRFHSELGEIQLTSYDDITARSQKCLAREDENDCCWMRLSHLEVEWGVLEPETSGDSIMSHSELWLIVNGTQCAFFVTLERAQTILLRSLDFERTLQQVAYSMRRSKSGTSSDKRDKGARRGLRNVKLFLNGFSFQFLEPHQVHSTEVLDPKKFNYGEPLGQIVITKMADERPRIAKVFAELNGLKESMIHSQVVAEAARIRVSFNKDMNHMQLDLNRGQIKYQELPTEEHSGSVVTLFSAAVASIVQTRGKRAVINVTDLNCQWTPDVHLFGVQAMLDLQNMMDVWKGMRARAAGNVGKIKNQPMGIAGVTNGASGQERGGKKIQSNFRLSYCVNGFGLAANLADGVDLHLKIRTVSSENGEAGVRLQNLEACLNKSRVLSVESLNISRLPVMLNGVSGISEPSDSGDVARSWEWIVEGEGSRVTLAYGLQARAIEDAVEDLWRGLKLALAGQKSRIRPRHKVHERESKGTGKSAVSSIRFLMNGIILEIEDEPLQGWLDEHYRLMLKVVRERLVREQVLEEKLKESERKKLHKGGDELETDSAEKGSGSSRGGMVSHESNSTDWESMQKELFKVYYDSCTALILNRGSGACESGRQSGFKPSEIRASLFSIKAKSLDVLLNNIAGGRQGMIERIRELDCVSPDMQVPFSRMYGYHASINASLLVVMLRNYTLPMLSAVSGRALGDIIFAKQGTVFPKQIEQEVYVGKWRRIRMLRSVSGSTPPLKMYSGLSIELDQGRVCYGVGFEPALADVSYALTVAMKKANLSGRLENVVPVKKERSLPWWDDMRYYVHGQNSVAVTDFQWSFLATTDPYEGKDMLVFASKTMLFKQSEGAVSICGRDFEAVINQECGTLNRIGCKQETVFIRAPIFELDIRIRWECESGEPLMHYLHALPGELDTREKVYDPFRSYFLALGWTFCFKENYALFPGEELPTSCIRFNDIHVGTVRKDTLLRIPKDIRLLLALDKLEDHCVISVPIMHLSAVDLMWVFKWWNLLYAPPHKLRSFSKWPRYGIARSSRSGNLSLDKVLCEFLLRVDSTPACIEHASLLDDDPAHGLTFKTAKLKYEILYSRGFNRHHPDGRRDILEMVYQGLDTHMLKAKLDRSPAASASEEAVLHAIKKAARVNQLLGLQEVSSDDIFRGLGVRNASDDGFLLSTDHFKSRRQTPKADPTRLAWWQVGDMDCSNGLSHSDPGYSSEPSDDEGFDVVLPDNCLRVSLYELKLLWTICNRDAVWAWVGEISKAFNGQKPSPSRQYAQRKRLEDAQRKKLEGLLEKQKEESEVFSNAEIAISSPSGKLNHSVGSTPKVEEEKLHFLVNVVRPQFNLHSEDATGRFLLAAGSGRVLARSFTVHSGYEIIEEALRSEGIALRGTEPLIPWKRRELSVWLERVQAHVAPCDVDLGAGLQWLPRVPTRTIPDRTGPLLERVFMPCSMFFQYTRHKGDTPDWKVKSLKELSFNSSEIKANMTSRQFQVMVDIIGDLLLARLPKPRKNSLLHPDEEEEEEEAEEEADEVVPEGVEEVELARIKLELAERRCRLLFDDIRKMKQFLMVEEQKGTDSCPDHNPLTGDREHTELVKKLELDFAGRCKARRAARASLRVALQRAAHQRLMEKEKYKTPSAAMSISWAIDKVVWRMLCDGTAFATAEISDMILNVDRDFNDQGVASFTMKSFIVQDCLQTTKLNAVHASLLSAWNPPAEWGRNCMLRVFAKQGAPKDGHSPLELFEVEVFPLRIHLTEAMYRMMWEYFFPEDDQNSQERQEARRLSAISMSKRTSLIAGASGRSTDQQVDVLARSASGGLFQHLSSRELKRGTAAAGRSEGRTHLSMERKLEETEAETVLIEGVTNPLVLPSAGPSKPPASRRHCSAGGGAEFVSVDGTSKSSASNRNSSRRQNSGSAISVGSLAEHGSARLKEKDREKDGRRSSRDGKPSVQEERDAKVRKSLLEFHNIKISQVELTVTYEGSRLTVSDLRLLMDTFARPEFTGSWRRLFSQVKKHIIWSVLKSVTGMQGKKFKDKLPAQVQADSGRFVTSDSNSSDSGGSSKGESLFLSRHKRQSDRAGAAFVSSVKGIFNSQRRKAAALVRRTMPGEGDLQGDWSEGEAGSINRQGSISKAKQLLRRHAKKFRPTIRLHGVSFFGERLQLASSHPSSDDDSDASSAYENPMD